MLLESANAIRDAIKTYGPEAHTEWNRLGFFEAYYDGVQRPPYEPETATREFKELVHRSYTNLMRLIIKTLTQRLVVDGFRASAVAVENAPQWEWWQVNGLDSRQKAVYTESGKHGYSGVMVLPGEYQAEDGKKDTPVMRPVSPREWFLSFEDHSDDWPQLALKQPDENTWHVFDERARYVVSTNADGDVAIKEENVHDLGVVPLVPFRNEWCLTHYPDGEIAPCVALQDRLNQTVFDLLVAQTYSAAPQKWAAGLSLPTDDKGQPITDLRAFAKALWMTSEKDAKFGSLPEANLANIVNAIEQALRMFGLVSQTPPHYLLGDLVNLSAEALLAADTSLAKKTQERQMLYGEAWEQCFRLAGVAAGNKDAANDTEAQVWWRDTEPRSIAQQVDALGKLATMLQVPVQALWEEVPGMTGGTLQRWRTESARNKLAQVVAQRNAQPPAGPPQPQQQPPPPGANLQAARGRAEAVGIV